MPLSPQVREKIIEKEAFAVCFSPNWVEILLLVQHWIECNVVAKFREAKFCSLCNIGSTATFSS